MSVAKIMLGSCAVVLSMSNLFQCEGLRKLFGGPVRLDRDLVAWMATTTLPCMTSQAAREAHSDG